MFSLKNNKKEGPGRDLNLRLSTDNLCTTPLSRENIWCKLRVSFEKSISSLRIGLNVPLKDSKYKTPEKGFQNVPFFGNSLRKSYALVSEVIKDRKFTSE